jgi:hypothetical protein
MILGNHRAASYRNENAARMRSAVMNLAEQQQQQ